VIVSGNCFVSGELEATIANVGAVLDAEGLRWRNLLSPVPRAVIVERPKLLLFTRDAVVAAAVQALDVWELTWLFEYEAPNEVVGSL
jgi:hypothetical protein